MMRTMGFCLMINCIIALIISFIAEYKNESISADFPSTLFVIFVGFAISAMGTRLLFL